MNSGGSKGRARRPRYTERWVLGDGGAGPAAATLRMPPHVAWRQLPGPAGQYATEGDGDLVRPLLAVRGIIV